jgi:hypothetical protein
LYTNDFPSKTDDTSWFRPSILLLEWCWLLSQSPVCNLLILSAFEQEFERLCRVSMYLSLVWVHIVVFSSRELRELDRLLWPAIKRSEGDKELVSWIKSILEMCWSSVIAINETSELTLMMIDTISSPGVGWMDMRGWVGGCYDVMAAVVNERWWLSWWWR